MAISNNNILRFTNHYRQGTVEAVIVSYWKVVLITTPNTYAAMAEAFANVMMTSGQGADILNTGSVMYRTVVDNVTLEGLEGGEWAEDIIGAAGGSAMPDFAAIAIKQSVESRVTRNGYKRMPFISEDNSEGNNVVIGTTVREGLEAFWGDVVDFIWDTEDGDINISLQPVVVGRTETPPDSGVYVIDLAKVNPVTSATVTKITSQNSRKS